MGATRQQAILALFVKSSSYGAKRTQLKSFLQTGSSYGAIANNGNDDELFHGRANLSYASADGFKLNPDGFL